MKYTCKHCQQERDKKYFFAHPGTRNHLRLGKCKKCCAIYQKERRTKNKQILVYLKGGKCEICDYNRCLDALDFHHETEDKEFDIGRGKSYSLKRSKMEIEKCKLLCNRCHKEVHAGLLAINGKTIVNTGIKLKRNVVMRTI